MDSDLTLTQSRGVPRPNGHEARLVGFTYTVGPFDTGLLDRVVIQVIDTCHIHTCISPGRETDEDTAGRERASAGMARMLTCSLL